MTVGTERGSGVRGAGAELAALRARAGGRPLAIAHRAGNDPKRLLAAESVGIDLIEVDVWLYRGRVEVRHKKTLGPYLYWEREPVASGWPSPLPYLRDRWRVLPGWAERLTLDDILAVARPETRFMLDLKGRDVRLAEAVLEIVRRHRPAAADGRDAAAPILVCSPFWNVLEAAGRHGDVRLIYTVGRDQALKAIWTKLATVPDPAVSIHVRYLGKDLPHLARFKAEGVGVITWPINDGNLARNLTERGTDGLIVDDVELLRQVVSGAPNSA
jgi:glycerophosphoryl diester phosphodiesterase